MQGPPHEPTPPVPSPSGAPGSISHPATLNGAAGHVRQKPSRVGVVERPFSPFDGPPSSALRAPRSNPSPPPLLHHRQYSEGAGVEKNTPSALPSGRNASVSSLDTTQPASLVGNSVDGMGLTMNGNRRRAQAHGHSHAHSHHHHPTHSGAVPAKPASMMSINSQ
jgi:hypothetical protein